MKDCACTTSNPPKVKCKLTGEYHLYDDECDCQDSPKQDYEEISVAKIPAIASVLDVEIEETFMIKGYPKLLFWINSEGKLNCVGDNYLFATDLVACINDNSNIIHIPQG